MNLFHQKNCLRDLRIGGQDNMANNSVDRDFKNSLKSIISFYNGNLSLKNTKIAYYRSIFYPIAKLQLEMEELNFEEFDYVNLCVLKLFSSGLTSASSISDFTGLPFNFIQNVLYDLEGAGQISQIQNVLTEMGKESLKLGKKTTKFKTWQTLQADAVTGNLLKIDFSRSETKLYSKHETKNYLAHVMYMDYIDLDYVQRQLVGESRIRDYKRYKADILNANVDQIVSARCNEVKYMNAFLVSLDGIKEPFPIILTFTRKEDRSFERIWRPLFLPESVARAFPDFAGNVPRISDTVLNDFRQFCNIVTESINQEAQKLSLDEKKKLVAEHFQLDIDYFKIQQGSVNGVECNTISISPKAFTKINFNVLNLFELSASNAKIPYNVRCEKYNDDRSRMSIVEINVFVIFEQTELMQVAKQYVEVNRKKRIAKSLVDYNFNVKGEALIKALPKYFYADKNDA